MKFNYWNEKAEKLPNEELAKIQLKKGLWSARTLYEHIPFLKERYDKAGVDLNNINSLEDFKKIPYMTKKDFLDSYPDKLVCVEKRALVRMHCTSGTSGNRPTCGFYTQNDLEEWTILCAKNLAMIGVTDEDVFQNTTSSGLFTGGFGYAQGATKVGAMLIPFGAGMTEKQLQFFMDFGVTAIHAIPSFGLKIANLVKEQNIPLERLKLRVGIFGAEGWAESTRKAIEEGLKIKAYDNYGMTEACGPGVACECPMQNGLHIWSDHFYPEIIDPATGEVLPLGSTGELVLTSLFKEAVPIVRYRTGDITRLYLSECECGRTGYMIDRIKGRKDDMKVIKGVNIYPSQIEEEIFKLPYFTDTYLILFHTIGVMDNITVQVEIKSSMANLLAKAKAELEKNLYIATMMKIDVIVFQELTLPRQEGKAIRHQDIRDRPEGYKGWLKMQSYNGKQLETESETEKKH